MKWFSIIVISLSLSLTQVARATDQDPAGKILVRWKGGSKISTVTVSDVPAVVSLLQADSRVDHVEADASRHISNTPNDPYFASNVLLHLEQSNDHDIDASTAWDTTTGSADVLIAVIDTGVDTDHPDLVDNIWTNPNEIPNNGIDDDNNGYIDDVHGWDFVEDDNDPSSTPTSSSYDNTVVVHGTHVAGLIGAVGNNGVGVVGVNWTVRIMPLRVFDDQGNSSMSEVLDAIAYAQANGAKVMNMSYGGTTFSQFESDAITNAAAAGVLSVAAAGNENVNLNVTPEYPACYTSVIGVGATDSNDDMASFSNYGTDCVDVAAPGESILSTVYVDNTGLFPNEYDFLSGTSMSTPIVSGIAGLILAVQPGFSTSQITDFITSSADDIGIPAFGSGRVNAASAVAAAVADLRPSKVIIKAYTNSHKTVRIKRYTRTAESTPYFSWAKPASFNTVAEYYLQWGKHLNQRSQGITRLLPHYKPSAIHGDDVVYHFRVFAIDDQGTLSDQAGFRYRIDTVVPAPSLQSVQLLSPGNRITWKMAKHQHVEKYTVYRSTHANKSFKRIAHGITVTTYTDKTGIPGHTYYYKIRAIDDLGNKSTLSL